MYCMLYLNTRSTDFKLILYPIAIFEFILWLVYPLTTSVFIHTCMLYCGIVNSTCIYLCVAECWVEVPEAARCRRSADAAVWFLWACHLHLRECYCKFTKLCSHFSQARGDRWVTGVPGQGWPVSQARGDQIFALSTCYALALWSLIWLGRPQRILEYVILWGDYLHADKLP